MSTEDHFRRCGPIGWALINISYDYGNSFGRTHLEIFFLGVMLDMSSTLNFALFENHQYFFLQIWIQQKELVLRRFNDDDCVHIPLNDFLLRNEFSQELWFAYFCVHVTGNAANHTKRSLAITNRLGNVASFSSRLGTDLPLREHPQVPFQTYLQDRQRVFEALFPDKKRCKKLNDKEWRIYMLPLDFLFLSVSPIVDMRIMLQPPSSALEIAIPASIEKVLTLEATKWELRGLDYILKPSDFVLSIDGILYSEKRGLSSYLRGHLKLSVEFTVPPTLEMIPREVLRSVGEAVLNQLLQSMKDKVNSKLLEDYKSYVRELSRRNSYRTAVTPAT